MTEDDFLDSMPGDWYDRKGEPITFREWSRLWMDFDYRQIGEHEHGDLYISTVWMGIDHNYTKNGPPIIFETMVFVRIEDEDGFNKPVLCRRYATEEAALKGHAEVVEDFSKPQILDIHIETEEAEDE